MNVLLKTVAKTDMTHCLVCGRKFGADDERMNVYRDSDIIGAIHEDCYTVNSGFVTQDK